MNKIYPVGSYFELDHAGFIVNPCSVPSDDSEAGKLLAQIVPEIRQELGEICHSIWLRGSLAKGLASEVWGDIDLFVLVKKQEIYWEELPSLKRYQQKVDAYFSRKIPLECQLESYLGVPAQLRSQIAMLIVTQAVCLWGEDIQHRLGRYKPGSRVMLDYRWLALDVADFLQQIEEQRAINLGAFRSFMKVILRAGFELVMERSGTYTRDLYPAWRTFSEFFPKKEEEMKQALLWYLNPMPTPQVLKSYLEDFGLWLVEEVKRELKPPQR